MLQLPLEVHQRFNSLVQWCKNEDGLVGVKIRHRHLIIDYITGFHSSIIRLYKNPDDENTILVSVFLQMDPNLNRSFIDMVCYHDPDFRKRMKDNPNKPITWALLKQFAVAVDLWLVRHI